VQIVQSFIVLIILKNVKQIRSIQMCLASHVCDMD
jgi:hypothetical protein